MAIRSRYGDARPLPPFSDVFMGPSGHADYDRLRRAHVLQPVGGGTWQELSVFFFLIAGIYLAMAVFDSSVTGESGRLIGTYLRESWGGAAFIPLLFLVYLCSARLIRVRVPRPLGQVLGTAQLYLSLAFILGLARHAGWNPNVAAFEPGLVGMALAHFFILNFGALGTILAAVASFLFAALLFRSRILMLLILSAGAAARKKERPNEEPTRETAEPAREIRRVIFAPPIREPSAGGGEKTEDAEAPRIVRRATSGAAMPTVWEEQSDEAQDHLQTRPPFHEEPAKKPETTLEPERPLVRQMERRIKTPVEVIDDLLASLDTAALPTPEELLGHGEHGNEHHGERNERPAEETREPVLRDEREPVHDTVQERVEQQAADVEIDTDAGTETDAVSRPALSGVFPPPMDIFGPPSEDRGDREAMDAAEKQGAVIIETLGNFGVNASVAHIVVGPSVVQFQLELAPGTKVNKVSSLVNDLTMALAVVSVRVEAPIPGEHYVGIEIPNSRRRGIPLRDAMESDEMRDCNALLPLPMGMKVDSRFLVCGLEGMPHLLVAGTTGSGKSVFVNACILGMCSRRTPDELKLILVDPKRVEFAVYEGLPHLLARPVSDPRKAVDALAWAVQEMEDRMESFARAHVRNLASYNSRVLPKDRRPSIVVVVDELADLMYTAGKEVESLIVRLAQKARAAGIHLILATQRPSVDVITGLIKANVPARVAFAVPSQTDSRTIIDTGGADKLLGRGDMLFLSTSSPGPVRLQSPFITEERTLDFVEYIKGVFGEPEYIEFAESGGSSGDGGRSGNSAFDDPKMEEAIRTVMETGITSASGLQRVLSIGYPKAGRLVTAMEQLGILGPQTPNSTRPRDILMDEESAYEALERARGE